MWGDACSWDSSSGEDADDDSDGGGDDDGVGRGCNDATAVFNASSEREMIVQRYPCLAKSCAMERPMPREPPVIRTWRGREVAIVIIRGFPESNFGLGVIEAGFSVDLCTLEVS